MSTQEAERERDRVWANLCSESGCVCRICGAVPECGRRFTDNLYDDCRSATDGE